MNNALKDTIWMCMAFRDHVHVCLCSIDTKINLLDTALAIMPVISCAAPLYHALLALVRDLVFVERTEAAPPIAMF